MVDFEIAANWIAVTCYLMAALVAGVGVCAQLRQAPSISIGILGIGAAAHALALGLRWSNTGHGPFLGRYEAFSSHALVIVLLFLLLQWRIASLRAGAIAIASLGFLLLGVAALSPAAPTFPSPALRSPWLTIHVTVAKLALATAIAGGSAGLVMVLQRHKVLAITPRAAFVGVEQAAESTVARGLVPRLAVVHHGWRGTRPRATSLPGRSVNLSGRHSSVAARAECAGLERLSHILVGYTFFLMSIVLLSGAVWASAAWGSYWSWDPVETWSLAFWAGCAFVLHLRSTGWMGERWARAILALTVLATVSFVGYGHFGVSIHAAYIAP